MKEVLRAITTWAEAAGAHRTEAALWHPTRAACRASTLPGGSPAQGLDFRKAKVQSQCLLWEPNWALLM